MGGVLLAVVLHRARPVHIREQRRVFEAKDFQQLRRGKQKIVAVLMQRRLLRVDVQLQVPDPGEPGQQDQRQHQRGLHLRFRREKTAAATAKITVQ